MFSISRHSFRFLIALIVISLLSSCGTTTKRVAVDPVAVAREEAKQKALYVQIQGDGQERVQRLAYPMLKNAAPICDDEIRPSLGFIPANKYAWPKDYQDAAVKALGVGDQVSAGLIIDGSPAQFSGLQQDDVLLTIAGKKVPSGKKATERTWKLIEKQANVNVPIEITVDRGAQILTYEITPIAVCDTYAFLIGGSEVNAYADGSGIYITTGMLRFVQNDIELATVIAHELAHNAMEHTNKKTANYLLGSILDIAAAAYGINTQGAFGNAAAQTYSQAFEAEADYVGMYILAIAGYPIEGVANFWRRMGMENPGSIATKWISTHPGTAERYLALDATELEIESKISDGLPLRPDPKK
jgi:membrane-associated protease RseP (regulator of RpoE activity)